MQELSSHYQEGAERKITIKVQECRIKSMVTHQLLLFHCIQLINRLSQTLSGSSFSEILQKQTGANPPNSIYGNSLFIIVSYNWLKLSFDIIKLTKTVFVLQQSLTLVQLKWTLSSLWDVWTPNTQIKEDKPTDDHHPARSSLAKASLFQVNNINNSSVHCSESNRQTDTVRC